MTCIDELTSRFSRVSITPVLTNSAAQLIIPARTDSRPMRGRYAATQLRHQPNPGQERTIEEKCALITAALVKWLMKTTTAEWSEQIGAWEKLYGHEGWVDEKNGFSITPGMLAPGSKKCHGCGQADYCTPTGIQMACTCLIP